MKSFLEIDAKSEERSINLRGKQLQLRDNKLSLKIGFSLHFLFFTFVWLKLRKHTTVDL